MPHHTDTPARRPNLVVFVADQLRADHLGFGGNPVVHTPHLDALAARSARFDRAYVTCPVCMPNRASIVTGRMPSAHGTRHNGIPLHRDVQTFPRLLKDAGWRTAAVGKLHFQNMGWGWEDHQLADFEAAGFRGAGWLERTGDRDWYAYEDLHRHLAERVTLPDDYYGFDSVDLVVGHSDFASGHYAHWLADRGVDPRSARGRANSPSTYEGWEQVYASALPEELYPTRFVTEHATTRLKEFAAARAGGDDAPFLLFVSYPDPHHPFTPPRRWFERYAAADMPLPHTFEHAAGGAMPHFAAMAERRGTPDRDSTVTWAITEEQLRHAMAAEFGMISLLDESVGDVLATLDGLGLADDTAVAFTSDHGDMFGDHGLMLKQFTHYEGCVRVPLTLALPGSDAPRGERPGLVSSLDLAATALDLAGLPRHHGMQGQSLLPVVHDPGLRLREQLLIEEDEPFGLEGLPGPLRMRSLLTESARLTVYDTVAGGELYDLADDPDETVNLHDGKAPALRAELTERLAHELVAANDSGRVPSATG
ncbi:sulfatase [Streptomyces sp. NPDC002795]|uniref:sulfatase family protein n=1 Tax=Streptomyces sp. NPDC002795 TaxID=3364665 RepID=UPI0036AE7660